MSKIFNFIILFLAPCIANAAPEVSLSSADQNGYQWLIIEASGLENVYGVDLKIQYDTGNLKVADTNPESAGIQIDGGDLFANAYSIVNKVDPRKGEIRLASSLLNPAPAIFGSGVITAIPFEINQQGNVSIQHLTFGTPGGSKVDVKLPGEITLSEPTSRPSATVGTKNKASVIAPYRAQSTGQSDNQYLPYIISGVGVLVLLNIILFTLFRRKTLQA